MITRNDVSRRVAGNIAAWKELRNVPRPIIEDVVAAAIDELETVLSDSELEFTETYDLKFCGSCDFLFPENELAPYGEDGPDCCESCASELYQETESTNNPLTTDDEDEAADD